MAHILLADDDKATRDLVKRALESEGHNVEVTQDGTEALEKLKSHGAAVDVLVSDVHMPGIDGIDLASHAIDAGGSSRSCSCRAFPRSSSGRKTSRQHARRAVEAVHARAGARRRARSLGLTFATT